MTEYFANDAAMEERQARYRHLDATAQAILAEHTDDLRRLHGVVSPFFADEAAGKSYVRRPQMHLTLPATGTPRAWLVILPHWRQPEKLLDVEQLKLELVVERPQRTIEAHARLTEGGCRQSGGSLTWGEEAFQRAVATASEFLQDPFSVFSRSADFCCICRHRLRDGASRARGIGPECLKRATSFRKLIERHLATQRESETLLWSTSGDGYA